MLKNAFAICAALLLLGSAAMAQQSAAAKARAGDIKTLCTGVQPGEGRLRACIKSNFSKLSEPCQTVLLKAAAIGKACKDDVKKICAGIKSGRRPHRGLYEIAHRRAQRTMQGHVVASSSRQELIYFCLGASSRRGPFVASQCGVFRQPILQPAYLVKVDMVSALTKVCFRG